MYNFDILFEVFLDSVLEHFDYMSCVFLLDKLLKLNKKQKESNKIKKINKQSGLNYSKNNDNLYNGRKNPNKSKKKNIGMIQ